MIRVEKLSAQQWQYFSEDAHKIAFGELKPASLDRIDYALLAVCERDDKPTGYVTCRELDADSVYWQFGGAMPGAKETVKSFRTYEAFVGWHRSHYKRVSTFIENENTPMLKMAMKVGFRVVGIRNFKGSILLEHLLEF
jgi:hypothetical protein